MLLTLYRFLDAPLLWFVVGSLAAWRISSIIHHEKIAAPFRRLLGVKEITQSDWSYPDTFIGNLIECFYCTSVWVALGVSVVLILFPLVLVPFALSAAAIIVEEHITREK